MIPFERKRYWREHFARRLWERYGREDTGWIHRKCMDEIISGEAKFIEEGHTQIYRVEVNFDLTVYCCFDRAEQYVTSCLSPGAFVED